MEGFFSIQHELTENFKVKLLQWAHQFRTFVYLDSNNTFDPYRSYDFIIGIDELNNQKDFKNLNEGRYHFGHIAFDYNHEVLQNQAWIDFEKCFFFEPRYIVFHKNGRLFFNRNAAESLEIYDKIQAQKIENYIIPTIEFQPRTSQKEYTENIYKIQNAIRSGKFYELNYCVEFYQENIVLNALQTFFKINQTAQSPMSALVKYNHKWALCFSPERLACLKGDKLISQPIKGTARRDLQDPFNDDHIKNELSISIKEKAENTMIVDLVRNDMTSFAKTGSIQVNELCKIYTFPFVHQMISTISATLKDRKNGKNALAKLLPAGSMTGAPKKEVLGFIDEIENFSRGLYAGNIGYFAPDGDFDFNVVIRTLYFDEKSNRISVAVGGAITLLSDAEKEYHECLLKAEGILKFFKG
jgi:para-aminobenzoate synthetase component 1